MDFPICSATAPVAKALLPRVTLILAFLGAAFVGINKSFFFGKASPVTALQRFPQGKRIQGYARMDATEAWPSGLRHWS